MRTKKESGATIVVVISVIATMAVLVGAALDYTFTVARNVERTDKMQECNAIAMGCLNYEYMYWREYCRTTTTRGLPTSSFTGIPLPTSTQFPNISGFTATTGSGSSYTVSNYSVTALTPELQPLSGSTAPSPGVDATGTDATYFYRGTVTVTLPDRSIPVSVTASQIFEEQYESPWEWAIFFADPLEIEPGEPMTVDGWVQTNSSLYTPLNSLTFGNKVNYGLNWYISAMPSDEHLIDDGDTYADPNWAAGLPPTQSTPSQPFGVIPTDVFSNNSSNTNDGYHELIELPVLSQPDPLAGYRYFDTAGVKVLISENGSTINATVYDAKTQPTTTSYGNSIGTITYTPATTSHGHTTPASTTLSTGTNNSTYETNLATTVYNSLSFNNSIQDNREDQTVAITEVNVDTFTTALSSGGSLYNDGFNGVVYIDDEGSTASSERGIELTNGASLPSTGLSFASANPVYIAGDYNTGNSPPSDSGNTSDPTASGYSRAPSSVVADAVDILSNAWPTDSTQLSYSQETEGSRVATNTTVNTAILSGNVPSRRELQRRRREFPEVYGGLEQRDVHLLWVDGPVVPEPAGDGDLGPEQRL